MSPCFRHTGVDNVPSPYDSRERVTGSELTSMGLEEMYANPIGLAKKDKGLFDFIFNNVLR